jgi:hypothetical protein
LLAEVRRGPTKPLPPSANRADHRSIEKLDVEIDLVEIRFFWLFERRRGLEHRRLRARAFAPANPARHGWPGKRHRLSADDQTEVPRTHRHLEERGVGGGAADGTNRRLVGDRVPLTDEEHHGTGDIRERDGTAIDDEAPGKHSVVNDELVDELLEGRPGPRHEAFSTEEAPARLALLEGLPVVQLPDEVHELANFFVNGEKLEPGAGQSARQAFEPVQRGIERALGELEHAARDGVIDVRKVPMDVDRASKRHQRSDALRPSIRGGLIRKHPALRVADDMHVVASRITNPIDRITDRFDVVVEGALHAALFLFG